MINLFKTKQVRDEINEKPDETQRIIDECPYGICITEAKGHFVFVNDRYLEVYGYQRDELIGKHFAEVVPEENRPILKKLHDEFIETQREISRVWEVQRKDGSKIKIDVDARFTDKLNKAPHKITFVDPKG